MADDSKVVHIVPTVPTRKTGSTGLARTLRALGVNRSGLIRKLADIAQNGEKVTIIEKKGIVVERRMTYDPMIQMKAIDRLSDILDRADGLVQSETMTMTRKTYAGGSDAE